MIFEITTVAWMPKIHTHLVKNSVAHARNTILNFFTFSFKKKKPTLHIYELIHNLNKQNCYLNDGHPLTNNICIFWNDKFVFVYNKMDILLLKFVFWPYVCGGSQRIHVYFWTSLFSITPGPDARKSCMFMCLKMAREKYVFDKRLGTNYFAYI